MAATTSNQGAPLTENSHQSNTRPCQSTRRSLLRFIDAAPQCPIRPKVASPLKGCQRRGHVRLKGGQRYGLGQRRDDQPALTTMAARLRRVPAKCFGLLLTAHRYRRGCQCLTRPAAARGPTTPVAISCAATRGAGKGGLDHHRSRLLWPVPPRTRLPEDGAAKLRRTGLLCSQVLGAGRHPRRLRNMSRTSRGSLAVILSCPSEGGHVRVKPANGMASVRAGWPPKTPGLAHVRLRHQPTLENARFFRTAPVSRRMKLASPQFTDGRLCQVEPDRTRSRGVAPAVRPCRPRRPVAGPGAPDPLMDEAVEVRLRGRRPKAWRKCPDLPLGVVIASRREP